MGSGVGSTLDGDAVPVSEEESALAVRELATGPSAVRSLQTILSVTCNASAMHEALSADHTEERVFWPPRARYSIPHRYHVSLGPEDQDGMRGPGPPFVDYHVSYTVYPGREAEFRWSAYMPAMVCIYVGS